MEMSAADTVEEILAACRSMEGLPYDGEPVDQLEHALQCVQLARAVGGEREFVVACLLHDIARAPAVAGIAYDGAGEHHGEMAARWLEPRVGARIAWLAPRTAGGRPTAPRWRGGTSPSRSTASRWRP
jgi:predicted HD phosphohydrolase